MLEMTGISKRFDAVTALNKASLQVNAGEIMALLGSNGSGARAYTDGLAVYFYGAVVGIN